MVHLGFSLKRTKATTRLSTFFLSVAANNTAAPHRWDKMHHAWQLYYEQWENSQRRKQREERKPCRLLEWNDDYRRCHALTCTLFSLLKFSLSRPFGAWQWEVASNGEGARGYRVWNTRGSKPMKRKGEKCWTWIWLGLDKKLVAR